MATLPFHSRIRSSRFSACPAVAIATPCHQARPGVASSSAKKPSSVSAYRVRSAPAASAASSLASSASSAIHPVRYQLSGLNQNTARCKSESRSMNASRLATCETSCEITASSSTSSQSLQPDGSRIAGRSTPSVTGTESSSDSASRGKRLIPRERARDESSSSARGSWTRCAERSSRTLKISPIAKRTRNPSVTKK